MSDQGDRRCAGAEADAIEPQVVSSRIVYEGRVVTMRVDEITIPQGGTALREVVEHPGAVVIIALDDEGFIYLVRQYRHPVRQMLLELPAGCLEPDEEPLKAAQRELREEVGLTARDWQYLGSFYSSPGFVSEHLHVFLAKGLSHGETDPDYDEDLSVVKVTLKELMGRLTEIPDSKSLAALLLLREGFQDGPVG